MLLVDERKGLGWGQDSLEADIPSFSSTSSRRRRPGRLLVVVVVEEEEEELEVSQVSQVGFQLSRLTFL